MESKHNLMNVTKIRDAAKKRTPRKLKEEKLISFSLLFPLFSFSLPSYELNGGNRWTTPSDSGPLKSILSKSQYGSFLR